MVNVAEKICGGTENEVYCGFLASYVTRSNCMPKEKVQGKATCNIEGFSEYNHQRPLQMTPPGL